MATLFGGQGIDTSQVQDDREALPAGEYVVRIIESEVKASKSGGSYLELTIQVEDGPFKGRKFWEMVTLQNSNTTAVQIGQQTLKRLVKATGAPQTLTDSNQLHNLPFIAVTKIESDNWGDKTRMKTCKPYGNPAPQQAAPMQQNAAPPQGQAATQQQAAPGGGMPWNN